MKTLLIALLALVASSTASAAVIEAKTPLHQLAMQPIAQMKDGLCQITGAVVVNGELVHGADVGLRAQAQKDLVARVKTNEKGVYFAAVKVPAGTRLQEIVISNPTKQGKFAFFPGQVMACK